MSTPDDLRNVADLRTRKGDVLTSKQKTVLNTVVNQEKKK